METENFSSISFWLILVLFISSCNDRSEGPEIVPEAYVFIDDFETIQPNLTELFPADGSRWSNLQKVDPSTGLNIIELTQDFSSRGAQSLYFMALPSDEVVSKAGIEKSGLVTERGSFIWIKADFLLSENGSFENVFLIDLECCSCWDPSVPHNQCPGVRLMFDESGQYLQMERGKIGLPSLSQESLPFPRGEWVTVEWKMTLSDLNSGSNQLLINGQEAFNAAGINLPSQAVFDSIFTAEGIDFELQEPLGYERMQIGLTANAASDTARIWVDNVQIQIIQ